MPEYRFLFESYSPVSGQIFDLVLVREKKRVRENLYSGIFNAGKWIIIAIFVIDHLNEKQIMFQKVLVKKFKSYVLEN